MAEGKKNSRELVVVKVGSNAITTQLADGIQAVDPDRVADIARGINELRKSGFEAILVTSGAVAGGMHKENFNKRPGLGENTRLSALAAIGQSQLMYLYSQAFREYGITVAQGLPTQEDFHRSVVNQHMKDTLDDLLELGCVPILNENDFTSFAEMRFGDNDIIASLVAILCNAKQLVIFTVEDGIMTANPNNDSDAQLIENIVELKPELFDKSQEKSAAGSGGINSKLYSGDLCSHSGIKTSIANISAVGHLAQIINGTAKCSRFEVKNEKYLPIEEACKIVKLQTDARANPFYSIS